MLKNFDDEDLKFDYDQNYSQLREKLRTTYDALEKLRLLNSSVIKLSNLSSTYVSRPCHEGYCLKLFIPHRSRIRNRILEITKVSDTVFESELATHKEKKSVFEKDLTEIESQIRELEAKKKRLVDNFEKEKERMTEAEKIYSSTRQKEEELVKKMESKENLQKLKKAFEFVKSVNNTI